MCPRRTHWKQFRAPAVPRRYWRRASMKSLSCSGHTAISCRTSCKCCGARVSGARSLGLVEKVPLPQKLPAAPGPGGAQSHPSKGWSRPTWSGKGPHHVGAFVIREPLLQVKPQRLKQAQRGPGDTAALRVTPSLPASPLDPGTCSGRPGSCPFSSKGPQGVQGSVLGVTTSRPHRFSASPA